MKHIVCTIISLVMLSCSVHAMDNDGDTVVIDTKSHFIRALNDYRQYVVTLDLVTGGFEVSDYSYEPQTAWGSDAITRAFPAKPDSDLIRLKSKIEEIRRTINMSELPPLDPELAAQRQLHERVRIKN